MQDWKASCLGKCRNQVNVCWVKELLIDSNIHKDFTLTLNITWLAITQRMRKNPIESFVTWALRYQNVLRNYLYSAACFISTSFLSCCNLNWTSQLDTFLFSCLIIYWSAIHFHLCIISLTVGRNIMADPAGFTRLKSCSWARFGLGWLTSFKSFLCHLILLIWTKRMFVLVNQWCW